MKTKKAKKLNNAVARAQLLKQIKEPLEGIEREKRQKEQNHGYMIQYCPCGHFREIVWNEFELVEKAKEFAKTMGCALTVSSDECPVCKKQRECKEHIENRKEFIEFCDMVFAEVAREHKEHLYEMDSGWGEIVIRSYTRAIHKGE
jgi:hypothetical protein